MGVYQKRKEIECGTQESNDQNLSLSLSLSDTNKDMSINTGKLVGKEEGKIVVVFPLLLGDQSMHTMCHSVSLQQSPSLFLFHPFISQLHPTQVNYPKKTKKNSFFPILI